MFGHFSQTLEVTLEGCRAAQRFQDMNFAQLTGLVILVLEMPQFASHLGIDINPGEYITYIRSAILPLHCSYADGLL